MTDGIDVVTKCFHIDAVDVAEELREGRRVPEARTGVGETASKERKKAFSEDFGCAKYDKYHILLLIGCCLSDTRYH